MILEISDLRGGYGGPDIVKGVNCMVERGEILCLVGPNGCGKTTLFRLLLGLIRPSGGKISIDGMDTTNLAPKALANLIAYIPQQHTPIFSYTALDIVLMGRAAHFSAFDVPKPIDRDAAFDALEKMNCLELANCKYTSLSGGQRQMVLIARAICQAAQVFVMDEPAANLDYRNQQLLMDVAEDLSERGYCIIMSTHSPEHPLSIGDKVLLMRDGRVVTFGRPAEVINPAVMEEVYGIEMDIVSTRDRYGVMRTMCMPVKSRKKELKECI